MAQRAEVMIEGANEIPKILDLIITHYNALDWIATMSVKLMSC